MNIGDTVMLRISEDSKYVGVLTYSELFKLPTYVVRISDSDGLHYNWHTNGEDLRDINTGKRIK